MFKEIEQALDQQIRRIHQPGLQPSQIQDKYWSEFQSLLENTLDLTEILTDKNYSLHDRLPSQRIINKIQFLNECLTQKYHGKSNINLSYRFLIRLNAKAKLAAYSEEQYLKSLKTNADRNLFVLDATLREDKQHRQAFLDRNNTNQASYSSFDLSYGQNALDRLFSPRRLSASDNQRYLARSGMILTGLKLFQKRHKNLENWGQIHPDLAAAWLNQVPRNETEGEDRPINLNKLDDQAPRRYLTLSWTRELPLECLNEHARIHIARPIGTAEQHRCMPNQMPYAANHGLVICGSSDLKNDPTARVPNTLIDVEKIFRMLIFFNPPLGGNALPGEKHLCAFQNPRVSSSILATEHCHLAEYDLTNLYILKCRPFQSYQDLDLIQVGKDPDALVMHYRFAEESVSLVEDVTFLMHEMRRHFTDLDLSLFCFIQNNLRHVLVLPSNILKLEPSQEMVINSRGESDLDWGIPIKYGNPHGALGIFRIFYDGVTEHQVLNLGTEAIERYFDFISVKGMREFLNDHLEYMQRVRRQNFFAASF